MCGFELSLEVFLSRVSAKKEVSIESLEVAIDVFERGDRFDASNRCGMALGRQPRSLGAVQFLDSVVPVVEGGARVVGFDVVFEKSIEQSEIPFGGGMLGEKVRGFDRDFLRALSAASSTTCCARFRRTG